MESWKKMAILMYIKENKMRQTITGNTAFIKKTVLPMTKQAGIKKVSVKILPAQLPDDKERMEVSFDVDKETNDNLLDLLKKKAGKKGAKKRQNLNLTVMKELLSKIIKKEVQKLKKESINEAASWGQVKTFLIGIIRKKQAKKMDGYLIDMQTANAILKVGDALNKSNQKKFGKLPIKKMANVAWKLVS